MIKFDYYSLFFITEKIREKYPEAVLGFLGNSFAVCAVADRYFSDVKNLANEQYMIPFSGKHLELYNGKNFHLKNVYSDDLNQFADYFAFINNSKISPDKIINSDQQLVIIDRVFSGESLASFSHIWNVVAQKSGYSPLDIQKHFKLCAIEDYAIYSFKADAYHIFHQCQEQEICSTEVEWLDDIPNNILQDVLLADDLDLISRLCPTKDIDPNKKSNLNSQSLDLNKIEEFYFSIHKNIVTDQEINLPNAEIVSRDLATLVIS